MKVRRANPALSPETMRILLLHQDVAKILLLHQAAAKNNGIYTVGQNVVWFDPSERASR